MKMTTKMLLEIASHEAVVRQMYKDAVGVPTWSIGITNASGHNVQRYAGNRQSLLRCLEVYVWVMARYVKTVEEVFADVALTEAQFTAAVSFHYNTGAIKTASWVKLFKQGKLAEAEASLKSWNKAKGKVLEGLVTRRAQEANLLFRGKYSNDGTIVEYDVYPNTYQINWKSGRRIAITKELYLALANHYGTTPISEANEKEVEAKMKEEAAVQPSTPSWIELLWKVLVG